MSSGNRTLNIEILGNAEDAQKAFGQVEKTAGGLGGKLGKAAAVGTAAIGGLAVAGVAAAGKIGDNFDQAYDTIATGTGATGEQLERLQDDFRNVVSNVPADFDSAAGAISNLNTTVGATGPVLQDLSEGVLEASRMLGEDGVANSEAFGRAMQQWQVPAEDGRQHLDQLFQLSQDTGAGFGQLTSHLTEYGPVLQNANFSMEEASELFANLEGNGIAVSRIMPGLNMAFRNWADEGKNSREELERTVREMQNAESETEALAIATEEFGAEGAQRMVTAVRNGALSLDDLGESLDNADGSIEQAADQTNSLGESWQLFKNRAMVAIEPVATQIFQLASTVLDRLTPALGNLMDMVSGPLMTGFTLARDSVLTLAQALQGNWTDDSQIHPLHRAIGRIGTVIRERVIPFVMRMVEIFRNDVLPVAQEVFGRLMEIWGRMFTAFEEGGFSGLISQYLAELQVLGEALVNWILSTGLPMLTAALQRWGSAFIDWLGPQIPPLLERLGILLQRLGAWLIETGLPTLVTYLSRWGRAFIDWLGPQIPPLLEQLGILLQRLGTWLIETALPTIAAHLARWGQQFIAWVGPQIPPLLQELGSLLASLGGWLIDTALPTIAENLAKWGLEFITWVGPQIPPLLEELGILLTRMGEWIVTSALPVIVEKLVQWGSAFVEWVAKDAMPFIAGELNDLLFRITNWAVNVALPAIVKKMAEWAAAFVNWVADAASKLPGKLGELLSTIFTWVTQTGVPTVKGYMDAIGQAIVDGIVEGVKSMPDVLSSLGGWIADQVSGGLGDLIPGSPSQLGLDIGEGLSLGIPVGVERTIEEPRRGGRMIMEGVQQGIEDRREEVANAWLDTLGGLEEIASGEAAQRVQERLAELFDMRQAAIDAGLGEEVVAELDAQIQEQEAELQRIGKIAGTDTVRGMAEEVRSQEAAEQIREAWQQNRDRMQEAAKEAAQAQVDSFEDVISGGLEDIASGKAMKDARAKLAELMDLHQIAEETGAEAWADELEKQIKEQRQRMERIGEVAGTSVVQEMREEIDKVPQISRENIDELGRIFAEAPEIARDNMDRIVQAVADNELPMRDAMRLLGNIPREDLQPALEDLEGQLRQDLADALLKGSDPTEFKENLKVIQAALQEVQKEAEKTEESVGQTFNSVAKGEKTLDEALGMDAASEGSGSSSGGSSGGGTASSGSGGSSVADNPAAAGGVTPEMKELKDELALWQQRLEWARENAGTPAAMQLGPQALAEIERLKAEIEALQSRPASRPGVQVSVNIDGDEVSSKFESKIMDELPVQMGQA